jgi:hypothetical protein
MNYTYPTVSEIIRDTTVIMQMDKAWEMMLNTTLSSGSEYGFYIYYNHDTQRLYTGNIVSQKLTRGYQGTNSSVPVEMISNKAECCAFFHCHMNLNNCPSSDSRQTGPSTSDLDFATSRRLPGILYDYSRGRITGGHSKSEEHKVYTFGPERRQ